MNSHRETELRQKGKEVQGSKARVKAMAERKKVRESPGKSGKFGSDVVPIKLYIMAS